MAVDRSKITKNAEKYIKQGKIEQAIQLYKQLSDANPRDSSIKNKVGDLYVRAGRIPDAVKAYTELADSYSEEGFYLKAIAIYKKATRTDPSREDSYFKLADLYLEQGLKDDAKTQYLTVADLYAKAGNQSKMREALDKVVAIDPENVKVRARLADLYLRANMNGEAVAEYRAVGEELARKGMYEEALKVYDKALSVEDGNPGVMASLSALLLRNKDYDQLIKRAKAAYAKNRDNTAMLSALTEAYLKTNQQDLAQQVAQRLVDQEPANEAFVSLLQSARDGSSAPQSVEEPSADVSDMDLQALADADYSMEELEEVSGEWIGGVPEEVDEAKSPAAPDEITDEKDEFIVEHTTEAEVFIKYGLVEKAVEHLEAIVSHYPNEIETLRRLKDLYIDAGDKSRAAARLMDLATALRGEGDTERAEEAMREAESLDAAVASGGGDGYDAGAGMAESADVSADEFYGFGEGDPGANDTGDAPGIELDLEGEAASAAQAAAQDAAGEYESDGTALGDDEADQQEHASDLSGDTEHGFEIDLENAGAGAAPGEKAAPIEIDMDYGADGGGGGPVEVQLEGSVADELEAGGEDRDVEFFDDAIKAREDIGVEPATNESPLGEASESDAAVFDEESDFFHIADAIEQQQEAGESDSAQPPEQEENLEEILQEFKKGVDEQLGEEDYDTHYQLGIAYKEMGLVDEAIAEFQTAAKSERLFTDCCSHLGLCFREKGMAQLASKWYEKAVENLPTESEKYIAIIYDLGETYEEAGDLEKAIEMYSNVYALDSEYRDVADKITNLGETD